MAPRTQRRPCRTCPQSQQYVKTKALPATNTITTVVLSSATEGNKLWRHVAVGTGTCVNMIEQYTELEVPGVSLDALIALRDRLQAVIEKHEKGK